ncbi:recombinase family protein [Acidaminobacterium chupaoyuni]
MNGRPAIYLRLSREDGEGESQSIANQRSILTQYLKAHGMGQAVEFVDDGYSGLRFDRPAFQRLCRAIEAGEIDMVLTKDLSRLGRDYIQTGYYLERYFPEKEVRYIAVTDGIDTANGQDDLTPFRAVMNDLYAKDISKKVRAALDAKKRKGEFIGALPPYGYQRSAERHEILEIDPEKAAVVRKIFENARRRNSAEEIARMLEREEILSPSGRKTWSGTMVRRIVTNPTYCGKLTQNRARKLSYKIAKKKNLPPEEWVVVPRTHEPIVSEAEWRAAGKLMGKKKTGAEGTLWECGRCGAALRLSHGKDGWKARCAGKNGCGQTGSISDEDWKMIEAQLCGRMKREGLISEKGQWKKLLPICLEKIVWQENGGAELYWFFRFEKENGSAASEE